MIARIVTSIIMYEELNVGAQDLSLFTLMSSLLVSYTLT